MHELRGLRLHAKMLLADGAAAIVGSINFSPGSLDDRRELAIEISEDDLVEELRGIAHRDWKHSDPLDLSDRAPLADLEERVHCAANLGVDEES